MSERLSNANKVACQKVGETFIRNSTPIVAAATFTALVNAGRSYSYEACGGNAAILNQLIGAAAIGGSAAALTLSAAVYTKALIKELACPSPARQI